MIRNIIFDWSGTLVDDLPAVWDASNHVLTQAGRPVMTLQEFRAEFCLPFQSFYDKHTPGIPMPKLEEWFHGRFREVQASVSALPYAESFLKFCGEKAINTFLLSTVAADHFEVQERTTGFGKYLGRPYVGVWDKRQKIHEILAENHLRPEETLFVGDMQHDIETAKHGGVRSCAVLTGYNTLDQLRMAEPDLIVEHLGELQQILQKHDLQFPPFPPGVAAPDSTMPVVTVGGLIFNPKDEVLLVRTHKWSNLWGIPGGKIKCGESSTVALAREIKEETNLDIGQIEFVLAQDCIHSTEFYRDAHFVLLNYTCRSLRSDVILNEEAQEYRWLSLADALRLPLNSPTKTLLEDVRAGAGSGIQDRTSTITITDLEVRFCVGVPAEERAHPQRLLLTIEMEHDFAAAAATDDIATTINYFEVAQRLVAFGENRSWKLIEKLAQDLADLILNDYRPAKVTVLVKKFPIPTAASVSVRLTKYR